ncbi:MAG: amino acid ABC transporter permease [Magnetovibrio sp.]|nr:amino acid ABC transporter permease [Magnetovibrio sp.]
MYGFYEAEALWRPNLAGILLVFLGVPVLVPKIPGTKLFAIFLIFLYPWIALSLLVGPIKIALFSDTTFLILWGILIVALLFYGVRGMQTNDLVKRGFGFGSAYAAVVLLFLNWGLGLPEVETTKFGGLLLTLVLALTSIVVSLPLGILLALGRRAESLPVVMYFCIGVIELFRAVPLITVLFMAINMIPLFLPQGYSFDNVVMALIGLIIFFGAYLAEVVRGGLQAIPKGQVEAAASIGLNYYKSMRLIVLPQALKIVIPGIVNTFIAMTKDTSLVMIIGLFDILMITKSSITDAEWLGLEWEGYAFVGLLFWILCFSMSRYSQWLERRLDTDRRD